MMLPDVTCSIEIYSHAQPSGLSMRLAAEPSHFDSNTKSIDVSLLESKSLQLFLSCGYKAFIPNRNIMSTD